MILPPPALRHLAHRKLRGTLRKQVRRLRTPSGALFALIGAGVLGLWLVSIAIGSGLSNDVRPDAESVRRTVRVGGLLLSVLTLTGSLNHRGLYLPREEIEPLFSAPLTRAELVRYRLYVNTGRALFAALIFGLVVAGRVAHPLHGFVGVFLAMQTLAVAGQAVAIVSGLLEKRMLERYARGPSLVLMLFGVLAGALLFLAFLFQGDIERGLGAWLGSLRVDELLAHPVVGALTTPFEPWARVVSSASAREFALWALVCTLVWLALLEATARLPVDFRELSLETSASVAERIRRHRKSGGGASAGRVSRQTIGWQVPWLFGRGPLGALAWRKSVSIVRKLGGAFTISLVVLVFLTVLTSALFGEPSASHALGGAVLVALLGTVYLGGGLRFDFREDLDQMERIKTWPLAPSRVFAATLLPQVLLVSALLEAAVLGRALLVRSFHPSVLVVACALPLIVAAWVAIDNAVFLFAPVRIVPGQDGALQNAGRAMVLVLVRLVLIGIPGALVALAAWGAWVLVASYVGSELAAAVASSAVALLLLLPVDLALVAAGGFALRRFDVAR